MNQFYLKKFVAKKISWNVANDGRITYDYSDAVLLARASGLTSKKRRKVIKRFKKTFLSMLDGFVKQEKGKQA